MVDLAIYKHSPRRDEQAPKRPHDCFRFVYSMYRYAGSCRFLICVYGIDPKAVDFQVKTNKIWGPICWRVACSGLAEWQGLFGCSSSATSAVYRHCLFTKSLVSLPCECGWLHERCHGTRCFITYKNSVPLDRVCWHHDLGLGRLIHASDRGRIW